VKYFCCSFNSSPIDELGNWCHKRLVEVGALQQYKALQGGFCGKPVSRNQPCKWPPTSSVIQKELQWSFLLPRWMGRARPYICKLGNIPCNEPTG